MLIIILQDEIYFCGMAGVNYENGWMDQIKSVSPLVTAGADKVPPVSEKRTRESANVSLGL